MNRDTWDVTNKLRETNLIREAVNLDDLLTWDLLK